MGENNMPKTSDQSAPLELLSDQIHGVFSCVPERALGLRVV